MRQTWAIFVDAYRELNSKKLFWIVLALSAAVVAAFAAVGINDKGLTIFWWEFPSMFNAKFFPPELFYKLMFANLGVKFWLAWCSTILALIATAGIFPELISSGSVELVLSRPISRVRLFFTKYAAGLLFTGLQVTVFTAACFFVLGVRGGTWVPGIFWAIPLMVIFYSYLFCVCVLLGMITRSTVASLLITLLFWFAIFGLHSTEQTLRMFRERNLAQQEKLQSEIATMTKTVDQFRKASPDPEQSLPKLGQDMLERSQFKARQLETKQKDGRLITRWHTGVFVAKSTLPKTSETLQLLERVLVSEADIKQLRDSDGDDGPDMQMGPDDVPVNMEKVTERIQDQQRARPLWWVVGTSLGFEAVILGIACWIFRRRDF